MKRVLFIIQSYPSNRSANVLCDDKIMKAMLINGDYDIHCLVYRFHGQSNYEVVDKLKIHRLNRGLWWNIYTYARDNETRIFYRIIVKVNRLLMRLKQLVYIPIYPNYEPLLARSMAKAAIELHKQYNFDLVVAEHSGRDTLYAGGQLKTYDPEVKLVSILWDPISGRQLAKYLPKSYANYMMLKDESRLLSNSDRIISLQSNRAYQELYSKDKPFFKNLRFLDIPGIVRPTMHNIKEQYTKNGMINMLYSGILSLPDRDPSILIEIIKKSKYADKINLLFFAAGDDGKNKANSMLKDFKGCSLIHSYISKTMLNSVAFHSDVLLNLGGPNPGMVPSKIFEYMSLGKPIVSTYYIDNDSSKAYLDQYPASACIDIREPLEKCIKLFEKFIDHNLNNLVPFEEVEKKFPTNSPQEFIHVFEELL